ncbi:MAG: hypothetical protein LBR43_03845 [Spiroplasmataceae bacterium]|jgi:nucleotidyltransferase/DNA polymerase involved in DNA repair|nr:hypothetical protein [Spiroplasmataceae bacterium]
MTDSNKETTEQKFKRLGRELLEYEESKGWGKNLTAEQRREKYRQIMTKEEFAKFEQSVAEIEVRLLSLTERYENRK